jgi:hypothetical protein
MEAFLSARLIDVEGHPNDPQVSISQTGELMLQLNRVDREMWLQQPMSIGMTVDIALDPQSIDEPLLFQQEKGAWFQSTVRITLLGNAEETLITEVHQYAELGRFFVDLSPLQQTAPSRAVIQPPYPQHMLLAFYYPWFPDYGWSDTTLASDRPLVPISSLDPEAVAWQIEQARSAGIDGFIMSYNSDWSDDRLRILLACAQQQDFKVSLYLETLDSGGPVWPPGTLEDWIARAHGLFSDHPAFLKNNGEPVMFIFSSAATSAETWRSIFGSLHRRGVEFLYVGMGYDLALLDTFDGFHEYGLWQSEHLADVYIATGKAVDYYGALSASNQDGPKIWVATVSPGFDSTPYDGGSHTFSVDRNEGNYYRSTFQAALVSDPDWIVITSWNEYGENTHIEPSIRDGFTMLNITREYAERWEANRSIP